MSTQTPTTRRRNAERRVTGRSICVGLSEPNDPRVIWTDGTGRAACGRTDLHGPHTVVPRIVDAIANRYDEARAALALAEGVDNGK